MADEFCKVYERMVAKSTLQAAELPKKRKYHRAYTLSDAEIMVILILFHSSGYRCLKHFYLEYVCIHLRHLFPKVVSYNRFVELEKKALLVIKLWGNENIKYCHLSKLSLTEMRIFRRLSIFRFLNDR